MKIKRTKPNGKTTTLAEPELQEHPEPDSTRFVSKSTGRILVAVTSAGTIDFARMNRDARKQLQELLKTEAVQKQLGFGPPAATFDPEQCKHLYDAVGRVYQTIGKYFLKFPKPALVELLYTDDDKEMLGPATASMLDSYAPAWLAQHQAFAAWAVVFAGITQAKFAKANEVAQFLKINPQAQDGQGEVFPPAMEPVKQ
jgi:hypothetical protein